MVNYRETLFPKPDLTRIIGIFTYNAFQPMQLELKTNALFVHSNLGGATHGYLLLLMKNTKYATLSNLPYIHPVHPSILIITNNATRIASYELKRVCKENLQFFHEVRGVEQAVIQ